MVRFLCCFAVKKIMQHKSVGVLIDFIDRLKPALAVFYVHFISQCSELVSVSVVYMKLVIDR